MKIVGKWKERKEEVHFCMIIYGIRRCIEIFSSPETIMNKTSFAPRSGLENYNLVFVSVQKSRHYLVAPNALKKQAQVFCG